MKAYFIVGLMMMLLVVGNAAAISTDRDFEPDVLIVQNGEDLGTGTGLSDGDLSKPSFFKFGSLSFTSTSAVGPGKGIEGFSFDQAYGWWEVAYGKKVGTTQYLSLGSRCDAGQYIRYLRADTDPSISSSNYRLLFDDLWFKSNSDDIPNLGSFYTKSIEHMWVGYECFDGLQSPADLITYTCFDNMIVGEPGTSYAGINYECPAGCVVGATTKTTTSESTLKDIFCKDETTTNTPSDSTSTGGSLDIQILSADASSEVKVGDSFSVVGQIRVLNSACDGCVIETSMTEEGGASLASFSVLDSLIGKDGACGDDLSTGKMFSAPAGSVLNYYLWVTAREPGIWTMPVYATSGCHADGGKILDQTTVTVKVVDTGAEVPSDTAEQTTTSTNPEVIDSGDFSGDFGEAPTPEVRSGGNYGFNDITAGILADEDNIFVKFWNWLKSLFGL